MSRRTMRAVILLLILGGLWIGGTDVRAQNNTVTQRSFLSSPVVLGMGDAGVALTGPEQGFFYNPAHLPVTSSQFTILGAQGSATASLDDHVRFLNDRLNPVVEDGFDRSEAALAALDREANQLRDRPSRGHGGAVLPAFVYSPGAFGVGGGLFAKTAVNYRVEPGATDGPSLWTLSRTDLMGLLSVGLDLRVIGLEGLSVGATGTQTRRFLAFKNKPLRQFERTEQAVSLRGSVFQMDVGVTYGLHTLVAMPGTLRLGAAVYDVLERGWGYSAGGPGRLPFLDGIVDASDRAAEVDPAEARRTRRRLALDPSYRVGVAYERAHFFFMEDVAVAADVQGYEEGRQPLLSRLHGGARATLVGPLRVRVGVGGGYPSGGLGLSLGLVQLDYALHGVEEGRRFRQRGAYVHTARVMLRLD